MKMNPCIHCKTDENVECYEKWPANLYFVACESQSNDNGCRRATATYESQEQAIKAWNKANPKD